ncbi:MAG: cytochrome-c peroxidase [Bacteroidota bacterium]
MKNLIYALLAAFILVSCGTGTQKENQEPPKSMLAEFPELHKKASTFFGQLPTSAPNEANPTSEAKVLLGYTLYFDNRLSKDGNISCNSCHNLATFGVDNLATSPGDDGTLGDRNSPTVLNAALHMTQFWDGREPDVEAQAGGPILNPVEMAMPDEASVMSRLKGIDGYGDLFKNAYPDDDDPYTYQNLKNAIGVFERELLTPSKFDTFLAGDESALNSDEKKGLQTFIEQGCITCHMGNLLGGSMYQKLGLFGNYNEMTGGEKEDFGRFAVTNNEADKYMFKVPSLRNIAKTGPYFHNGAVESLDESVKIMAKLQLNKDLTDDQVKEIVTFMNALTGEVPAKYQSAPDMPM